MELRLLFLVHHQAILAVAGVMVVQALEQEDLGAEVMAEQPLLIQLLALLIPAVVVAVAREPHLEAHPAAPAS